MSCAHLPGGLLYGITGNPAADTAALLHGACCAALLRRCMGHCAALLPKPLQDMSCSAPPVRILAPGKRTVEERPRLTMKRMPARKQRAGMWSWLGHLTQLLPTVSHGKVI